MLQRDGISTVFVHRSFQEYFTAVFMSLYHGKQFIPMLDKFAIRTQDKVIPMLFEMAKERVESEWILPHTNEYLEAVDAPDGENRRLDVFRSWTPATNVRIHRKGKGLYIIEEGGALLGPGIFVLYWMNELHDVWDAGVFRAVEKAGKELVATGAVIKELRDGDPLEVLSRFGKVYDLGRASWTVEVDLKEIMTPAVITAFDQIVKTLRSWKSEIEKQVGGQELMMEKLLRELNESGPVAKRARSRARSSRS